MIEVSSASDIGHVRTSNEDSYGVFSPSVYVVADGLGGHAAGAAAPLTGGGAGRPRRPLRGRPP